MYSPLPVYGNRTSQEPVHHFNRMQPATYLLLRTKLSSLYTSDEVHHVDLARRDLGIIIYCVLASWFVLRANYEI